MTATNSSVTQKAASQDFCNLLQIGRTTFWRLTKMDGFPAPIRIGRAVRWDLAEVEAFLKNREAWK